MRRPTLSVAALKSGLGLVRNVAHYLSQLQRVDIVEEAVNLDVRRHPRICSNNSNIVFERGLEIRNADAVMVKRRGNIAAVFMFERVNDAFIGERRRTTE
ncbi:hypothetical protein D3C73_1419300 [compost metagenome]